MLMNRVEVAVVNSPPRGWLQRYEVRVLRRLGGTVEGGRVLELGCGSGFGTGLILDRFGARAVDALDLDPAMVARARRWLVPFGDRVRVAQGSATDVRAALGPDGGESGGYDAVFDFAIVHHVPDWRAAIAEVVRVLKPGGRFYFDEVTAAALATRGYRWLFEHLTEDRFTAREFVAEVERHGLRTRWRACLRGHYLIGVAERGGESR
jgi:SAM-dependent methyltransferase